VSARDSKAEIFDVFLCHNSEDKPAVREIAQQLVREGIKPWLDEREIRPGTSWQTALEQQIGFIKSAAVFVGDSGIGPWQLPEIQAFLNQFVKRACPVIPVVLASAKSTPKLPLLLENLHWVDFRVTHLDPFKQLIWGITGKKPRELSAAHYLEEPPIPHDRTELRLLPIGTASQRVHSVDSRLYPPLPQAPSAEWATQLEILRRRVKEHWVDGVLKHSLYNEVLISLGKRQADEFVDAPWKYRVEVSDAVSSGPLADRDVNTIYDAAGLLLILGEPGSGKTTTLLALARTLLDRSGDDIKERVPVVLNLSSWKKKQPLAEWISDELSEKYRVPRKIARFWLQRGYLLPLLDGLDEVQTAMQPDCVAALNAFIDGSNPSGLVVCCRLNEYRWLPERLKLNGAIRLEPLSSEEVSNYLAASGPKLAALREAVNTDPVLQELAQTPLMLSIMSLAYQGAAGNELASQKRGSLEERRKQIFRLYVEQMFHRKGIANLTFPKEKIIGWLSWLARKMRENLQSVFLVEGLQPSWLGPIAKRVAYGMVVALSTGLIFALIGWLIGWLIGGFELVLGLGFGLSTFLGIVLGCWSESRLKNGVLSGSIAGLFDLLLLWPMSDPGLLGLKPALSLFAGLSVGAIGGLGVGSLNYIALVETISWNWNQFWKRMIPGSIVGLIGGFILPLFFPVSQLQDAVREGLSLGLICGLVSGLIGGFIARVKADKSSPNQGIDLSRKNFLTVFLITCLFFGLIGGLTPVLRALLLRQGLSEGLSLGLSFGLIAGLTRGGSAVIKHYALRLIFWLNGYTPLNYVRFLDQCAKLILLKKVGGGYIFIHRMLLDYFADISVQNASVKRDSSISNTM
jgi:eukaryotic-like serine/threonine-protein kinase